MNEGSVKGNVQRLVATRGGRRWSWRRLSLGWTGSGTSPFVGHLRCSGAIEARLKRVGRVQRRDSYRV